MRKIDSPTDRGRSVGSPIAERRVIPIEILIHLSHAAQPIAVVGGPGLSLDHGHRARRPEAVVEVLGILEPRADSRVSLSESNLGGRVEAFGALRGELLCPQRVVTCSAVPGQ